MENKENLEDDILGFDPKNLRTYHDQEASSSSTSKVYKMKPAESKDEDHNYRCKIKVIYNPFNLSNSVIEQQGYSMKDADGYFYVVSKLTENDTSCPIFKAWKRSHFAKKDENPNLWRIAAKKDEGGDEMFDKRFARYVTIQVIEDKNHPENEHKYFFWKMPKSVWTVIDRAQNPAAADRKVSIPVMDFLFGCAVNITVTPGPDDPGHPERKLREIKYMAELSKKPVCCTMPDGSPLLDDEGQKVLDAYTEKLRDIWYEDNYDKAVKMEEELRTSAEAAALRPVYRKILEAIKGFCPNVEDEMSYHEWAPETAARVQRWLDAVMAGRNPELEDAPSAGPVAAPSAEPAPAAGGDLSSAGGDLPF